MKKFISIIIAVFILTNISAAAYETSAKSACLIEAKSGEVVYAVNEKEKLPMASTTKIMTAIVAIEYCNLDDVATVSNDAVLTEGSSAYLKAGAKVTIRDLLYGLMLNSGNDAAVVIAQYISGNEKDFAKLMTKTAKKIGARHTNFTNPNGLNDDMHYTTAYDLALIARYAMENEAFREIVSTTSYTADIDNTPVPYTNHNRLLRAYDGCVGIKTGFTKAAGRCLVTAVTRGGMTFIAVTLNDPNDWADHKAMYDEVFNEYSMHTVAHKGDDVKYLGTDLVYGADLDIPARNGDTDSVKIKVKAGKIIPPLDKGEKVGIAQALKNGQVMSEVDVCMRDAIYQKPSFMSEISKRFDRILRMIFL